MDAGIRGGAIYALAVRILQTERQTTLKKGHARFCCGQRRCISVDVRERTEAVVLQFDCSVATVVVVSFFLPAFELAASNPIA